MRRPNPQSEQNIRRIDTKARAKKQTHGFQVHFIRGTQAVTKMFSDSVYGGRESARRAARKFKSSAMGKIGRTGTSSSAKRGSARKKSAKKSSSSTKRRRR
jgi:hypothetical protein